MDEVRANSSIALPEPPSLPELPTQPTTQTFFDLVGKSATLATALLFSVGYVLVQLVIVRAVSRNVKALRRKVDTLQHRCKELSDANWALKTERNELQKDSEELLVYKARAQQLERELERCWNTRHPIHNPDLLLAGPLLETFYGSETPTLGFEDDTEPGSHSPSGKHLRDLRLTEKQLECQAQTLERLECKLTSSSRIMDERRSGLQTLSLDLEQREVELEDRTQRLEESERTFSKQLDDLERREREVRRREQTSYEREEVLDRRTEELEQISDQQNLRARDLEQTEEDLDRRSLELQGRSERADLELKNRQLAEKFEDLQEEYQLLYNDSEELNAKKNALEKKCKRPSHRRKESKDELDLTHTRTSKLLKLKRKLSDQTTKHNRARANSLPARTEAVATRNVELEQHLLITKLDRVQKRVKRLKNENSELEERLRQFDYRSPRRRSTEEEDSREDSIPLDTTDDFLDTVLGAASCPNPDNFPKDFNSRTKRSQVLL